MTIAGYQQFKVLRPGLFTTVQDCGRYGWQKYGVPVSGVLDHFASGVANLLLGNSRDAALLECTISGPTLFALDEAMVAITGAAVPITINDQPAPGWTVLRLHRGDILQLGSARAGCRAYLAVSGGIAVPPVMGSRSCYPGAGIGGHNYGLPLREGDRLARGPGTFVPSGLHLAEELRPDYPVEVVLRAIPGPQDGYFDQGLELFFSATFQVSNDASRMGYRLQGDAVRQKAGMPASIISEPSFPGGVQIPPDGQPIIILVEQTVGGYSKIATVIASDLQRLAQALPGHRLRFARVSLEQACLIAKEQAELLATIKKSLADQQRTILQDKPSVDESQFRFAELYPECLPPTM